MSHTTSSVKDLAITWSHSPMPAGWDAIAAHRKDLYAAAAHTIHTKAAENIPYDPLQSIHFKWAAQWLQVAEGIITDIDPNVAFLFNLEVRSPPVSHKHLSAADRQ